MPVISPTKAPLFLIYDHYTILPGDKETMIQRIRHSQIRDRLILLPAFLVFLFSKRPLRFVLVDSASLFGKRRARQSWFTFDGTLLRHHRSSV